MLQIPVIWVAHVGAPLTFTSLIFSGKALSNDIANKTLVVTSITGGILLANHKATANAIIPPITPFPVIDPAKNGTEGNITVALDVTLTEELKREGLAREFINRIQNLRKDSGFEVTDKINIEIVKLSEIEGAINAFGDYIAEQTLAESIKMVDSVEQNSAIDVEIEEGLVTQILIKKIK